MPDRDQISRLRALWTSEVLGSSTDYVLLAEIEGSYAARSQDGMAALVFPMSEPGSTSIGRRASGCELLSHTSIQFAFEGREWTGPAAVLLCNDVDLIGVFAVLAADLAHRVSGRMSWDTVLELVEEWQTLLTPRGVPAIETEIGLWGELWFICQSVDAARTLAGWRGPEGDATDFFIDGKAVEIKTSRVRRQHYVSQSQVTSPVGEYEAWLLSIWIKNDPTAALTVPSLVERILENVTDRADAWRRLARAGYSPSDRGSYTSGFVVLSEPEWFAASSIPRIRAMDSGISHLRYRVVLDEAQRADERTAARLWRHFHGREFGGNER